MGNKKEFYGQTIQIGDSVGVTIPSRVVKELCIERNQDCKIMIEKIETSGVDIDDVICIKCKTIFSVRMQDDVFDCPNCGEEILKVNADFI